MDPTVLRNQTTAKLLNTFRLRHQHISQKNFGPKHGGQNKHLYGRRRATTQRWKQLKKKHFDSTKPHRLGVLFSTGRCSYRMTYFFLIVFLSNRDDNHQWCAKMLVYNAKLVKISEPGPEHWSILGPSGSLDGKWCPKCNRKSWLYHHCIFHLIFHGRKCIVQVTFGTVNIRELSCKKWYLLTWSNIIASEDFDKMLAIVPPSRSAVSPSPEVGVEKSVSSTRNILKIDKNWRFSFDAWHILASSVAHLPSLFHSFGYCLFSQSSRMEKWVKTVKVGDSSSTLFHQAIKPCRFPMLSPLHDLHRFSHRYGDDCHSAWDATRVPYLWYATISGVALCIVMWCEPQQWRRVTLKLGGLRCLRCLWVCADVQGSLDARWWPHSLLQDGSQAGKETLLPPEHLGLQRVFKTLLEAPSLERLMLIRLQEQVLPTNYILVSVGTCQQQQRVFADSKRLNKYIHIIYIYIYNYNLITYILYVRTFAKLQSGLRF